MAYEMTLIFRPLEAMEGYKRFGNFPYSIEGEDVYHEKLRSTVNRILETDLPMSGNIDFYSIAKIKKLLAFVAASVPFKHNTQKLSELTEVSRPTSLKLFSLLKHAQLIHMLESDTKGIRKMGKPEKLLLHNTNLMYALAPDKTNKGQLRETIFIQHLSLAHSVEIPLSSDFVVDGKYVFETGGHEKGFKQLTGLRKAFVVADDIETVLKGKSRCGCLGFCIKNVSTCCLSGMF
jgi:hypothetical protein